MVALSGTGWRLAPCLVALVEETDRLAPNRSTLSDGSIGDPAHAARTSDHNPAGGFVCAVDITDDKDGGCDADLLARHLVASRDPRIKYVIWNRTIAGPPAWTPRIYDGVNAHEKHTHVSVHNTAVARADKSPWWPQSQPTPNPPETDAMTPEQEKKLDRALLLAERIHNALGLDGKTDKETQGNILGRVNRLYEKLG